MIEALQQSGEDIREGEILGFFNPRHYTRQLQGFQVECMAV